MGDGHLNKCKACTKRDTAERYSSPEGRERIRAYERLRFQSPERKAKVKEYRRRMKQRNAGKVRARWKLHSAVLRGRLEKKPCEVCKSSKSQAHHVDYRKPLAVRWLCFKHHREAHGQLVGNV